MFAVFLFFLLAHPSKQSFHFPTFVLPHAPYFFLWLPVFPTSYWKVSKIMPPLIFLPCYYFFWKHVFYLFFTIFQKKKSPPKFIIFYPHFSKFFYNHFRLYINAVFVKISLLVFQLFSKTEIKNFLPCYIRNDLFPFSTSSRKVPKSPAFLSNIQNHKNITFC